jgi:hypothetical protein
MNNEMMRPCTRWGQTFDAGLYSYHKIKRNIYVFSQVASVTFTFAKRDGSTLFKVTHEAIDRAFDGVNRSIQLLNREANNVIYEALNAPVLVTQAVMEAMKKVPEAKFSLVLDDKPWKSPETRRRTTTLFFNPHPENVCWYGYPNDDTYDTERIGIVKDEDGEDDDYIDSGYIQADCPLALQVLLGFTTEGVPVNE